MKQSRHVRSAVSDTAIDITWRRGRRKIESDFSIAEKPKQWYAGIQLRERRGLDVWNTLIEFLAASNAGEHEANRLAANRKGESLQVIFDCFRFPDIRWNDGRSHLQLIAAERNTEPRPFPTDQTQNK
jgi:hypothetical protein